MDPERQLALVYVPAARRPALEALWRLDVALGEVLATGRDPMISRIRFAWWREALEQLDRAPSPAEPVLGAVALHLLPAGLTGAALAGMEQGWTQLLSPGPPTDAELDDYARLRGGALFAAAARLLGHPDEEVTADGEAWALVDLARRSSDAAERQAALAAARRRKGRSGWPKPLRPLGMLAMLAWRDAAAGPDLERQGAPARLLRMVRHHLTGR